MEHNAALNDAYSESQLLGLIRDYASKIAKEIRANPNVDIDSTPEVEAAVRSLMGEGQSRCFDGNAWPFIGEVWAQLRAPAPTTRHSNERRHP